MFSRWFCLVLICAFPLLAACATSGYVAIHTGHVSAEVEFGKHDVDVLRSHYAGKHRGNSKHTPPGHAKKGGYPPGIAKQLQRGKGLPPGLDREPLPADLERRLTPLPKGCVRIRVGADLVIMHSDTRVVVDILRDIAA